MIGFLKRPFLRSRVILENDRVILKDNKNYNGTVVRVDKDKIIIQWDRYSKGNVQPYKKEQLELVKNK